MKLKFFFLVNFSFFPCHLYPAKGSFLPIFTSSSGTWNLSIVERKRGEILESSWCSSCLFSWKWKWKRELHAWANNSLRDYFANQKKKTKEFLWERGGKCYRVEREIEVKCQFQQRICRRRNFHKWTRYRLTPFLFHLHLHKFLGAFLVFCIWWVHEK